jgi:hypothetical protein
MIKLLTSALFLHQNQDETLEACRKKGASLYFQQTRQPHNIEHIYLG